MGKAKHISFLTNGPASLSSPLSTHFFLPPSKDYMILGTTCVSLNLLDFPLRLYLVLSKLFTLLSAGLNPLAYTPNVIPLS